ncbi:MAG: glycerol-3-phosphate 1-O-acyltransferase PlsY [Nitrospirae bacterium]|nr:glycerol-3-phosphate 1-O-acyltransferase PlsY [Nitrospirota bacterium]MBI3594671.1 glycerol-3-phosphate 1-O-acyltransferase PlsY [Nitrospirota bacterium]
MGASFSMAGILMVVVAFLMGGIPFGVIVSKSFWKIDPRKGGSGGIGFTNVMRVVGKKAAFMTLTLDTLKGTVPVLLIRQFTSDPNWISLVALFAVLGHTFSIYLVFKGGKGIATGFGVILGISPLVAVITFFIWNAVYFTWKFSSLAGLISFTFLPVTLFLTGYPQYLPFSFLLMLMIYYKHIANIKRLINGTENRMSSRPK